MMHVHRAPWVLPIVSPPIADGAVVLAAGRVVAVGPADEVLSRHPGASLHEYEGVLLPALVNAHTHLGLTGEAGRHPAGQGLLAWLRSLVPRLRELAPGEVARATADGLEQCRRLGTGLVGDIVSHADSLQAWLDQDAVGGRLFLEFLGVTEESCRANWERARALSERVRAANRPRIRAGVSPHAPYSVWPGLWRDALAGDPDLHWTTHLAEIPEEAEYAIRTEGPIREYMEWLGVWDGSFPALGQRPVPFLDRQGLLSRRSLFVHGVHLTPDEIHRLHLNDAALCLCPRSNAYLGLPPPPVRPLFEAGVHLCLGTDSLASNHDLGVWGEMRAIRGLDAQIPAERILRMATVQGAAALGFPDRAGGLAPDRPADLLLVEADPGSDPEEFLVREAVEAHVRRVAGPGPAGNGI